MLNSKIDIAMINLEPSVASGRNAIWMLVSQKQPKPQRLLRIVLLIVSSCNRARGCFLGSVTL